MQARMRYSLRYALTALMGLVLLAGCQEPVVRKPAVAGAFYPADPQVLQKQVDGFLQVADPAEQPGEPMALVSPHAGYVYSGQVAAYGYKAVAGMDFDTVVLIGAAHRVAFEGASVYAEGVFETPLGHIEVDERLARSLLAPEAGVHYYPDAYNGEHSLEVQMPFLQTVLPEAKIVPILIGRPSQRTIDHLSDALYREVSRRKGRVLIVASTDLSHYHSYDKAVEMDTKTVEAIGRLSSLETRRLLGSGEGEMCGAWPVVLTLELARRLGANRAEVFEYKNSGDVTNDRARVVGYASVGIYRDPLNGTDRTELLDIARETVRALVTNGTAPGIEAESPRLLADGAAFVTITRNGMLRGCIGHLRALEPLYLSVYHNAQSAAIRDPRFKPITPAELDELSYEVSVLSPMVPVDDVGEIRVGTHGLFIMKDGLSGVLLPQVPVEQGWDREEFLRQVCRKAGLPPDAWQNGARLMSFTADVFH